MQKKLADGLLKYSKQWCVREGVEAYVLHSWLFVSNPLMIPKYKMSLTSSIKKARTCSNNHEKYVLVPADKAANNVIIVLKEILH